MRNLLFWSILATAVGIPLSLSGLFPHSMNVYLVLGGPVMIVVALVGLASSRPTYQSGSGMQSPLPSYMVNNTYFDIAAMRKNTDDMKWQQTIDSPHNRFP